MKHLFKNHFVKTIAAVFLLSLYFIIFSCGEDDVKPIVDYRCQVTMTSSSAGKVYANIPVPIDLKVKKNDNEVGNYEFSYQVVEGGGDIVVNEQSLKPDETFPVNLDRLSLSYIPTHLGAHKLKFRFKNEEYFTEAVYVLSANELAFEVNAENLPKKLLIDKAFAFDLNLVQKAETKANEFNAMIEVVKGKGFVSLIGSGNADSLKTRAGDNTDSLRTRATTDYKVKQGTNTLHYKSVESGENVILLRVQNEYGYSQDLSVPLDIQLPEFVVRLVSDSLANVGVINNFLLNIEDVDNFGQNEYSVTYRNIKNSGTLKINNNELQVGSTLLLKKGDNVCEFIPKELGTASLEFIVKDKYNTTKKDTVVFSVERSFVKINVSNYDSVATIYDTRDISFSVNKVNYAGKYYFDLQQSPLNASSVKVNGADYKGGKLLVANAYNTLISFVPKTVGDIHFTLKVYDDYDSESSQSLRFKVTNSTGKVAISNYTSGVNIFNTTNFNFAVTKPNYTGKFQYEIIQQSGLVPGETGKIKVNGVDYRGGRMDVSNSNNMSVAFTPEKTGEVSLKLKVYDDFGGVIEENLPFSVNNTDIKVTTMDITRNQILGKETTFTFSATKPYYSGQLSYSISQLPLAAGTLKVNGSNYLFGNQNMQSGNTEKISFTPLVEGPVELIIKVADEWGRTTTYPVTYNVTNPPIRVELTNYVPAITFNTESIFNFSVNKDNYTGSYHYSIVPTPSTAGKIKINDQNYPGGIQVLDKPGNTRVSFLPEVNGEVSLKLVITDDTKASIERELIFKVENPKLNISITSIEDDLKLNQRSSFNFAAQKKDYPGKYYYEITGENCQDFKVGNQAYTPGQKLETTTPLGTNVSFVPTKVGRDTVKIAVRIFDDWGGMAEQKLRFSVTNSDIELKLDNVESSLFVGRESKFSFTTQKPGYSGNLKYEIKTTPSTMGTLKVNGEDYISGQQSVTAGKAVPVTFTPTKEGSVNVKLTVFDDWSGEKSQSFNYTITSTPIIMEISDYVADATLNTATVFNMALSKLYYTGGYNYSITTTPATAGTIKVNDVVYSGGRLPVTTPANTKISFLPAVSGEVAFIINVTDNIGGKQQKNLLFKVANNPVSIIVNNQETGLTVNQQTGFNFAVSKANYTGKYQFEVLSEPVSAGVFSIGGTEYKGGRMEIATTSNTRVNFTPATLGNVKLIVKAYDEFGGEAEKEIPYFVKNSEFRIVVSNQEKDIYNGQKTTFNFGVLKPNYSGKYKFEIIQTPENSGELKVGGSSYIAGKADLTQPVLSSVEYISRRNGLQTLTIKVYDELGGETKEDVIFNSLSSEIEVNVTNKEDLLVLKTPTSFNVTASKSKYAGTFNYEIVQVPAASGTLTIDGKPYTGGIAPIGNPDNLLVGFTPTREGRVSLQLNITDNIGGKNEQLLDFTVANPEISIAVTNHVPDILVNAASQFNFAVTKPNYTGGFTYQIEQTPSATGTLKVNGVDYTGARLPLTDKNNNTVVFNASKPGAVTLKLTVTDEWGKESSRLVNYSVSNTDIKVDVTNKEHDLLLSKATTLNFAISKPGYTGGYEVKFTQEPEASGTLKLNNSAYTDGFVSVTGNNTLEFIPSKTGAALLKLTVKDEHGSEKEVALNFNVTNPEIKLTVTNKEDNLVYNTATALNVAMSKEYYNGTYDFQIEQVPAAAGTLTIDGKAYAGGIAAVTNPNNLLIGFTPTKEGRVSLKLKIMDKVGMVAEKLLDFTVDNPAINLAVTNHTPDAIVNAASQFNFAVSKANYKGSFKYQIVQEPAAMGTLTVNGQPYNGSLSVLANAIGNTVTFTPAKTGSVTLKLTVSDEWGKAAVQPVSFSISNTDIAVNVTNKEYDLLLNKATTLNFAVSKPNYSGGFKAKIVQEPAASGTLKMNGNAHAGETVSITAANTLEFIPKKVGAALLKLIVTDDLGGEKEVALNFNVTNPAIKLTVTNKEDNLVYNTATALNVAMSKEYYNGTYDFQIEQVPAAAGTLTIDGKAYAGGIAAVTNPNNLLIGFTPTKEGRVSLKLKIMDKVGMVAEKPLDFTVANPDLLLSVTNHTPDAIVNAASQFNFAVSKANYRGTFKYQIEQIPAASGKLKVNGADYTGALTVLASATGNTVAFTPTKTGSVTLKLTVSDDWGKTAVQQVTYSVSNTDILVNVTNKEHDLLLNKATTLNFTVTKPNYAGGFKAKIVQEPAASGSVKLNTSIFSGSTPVTIPASNTLTFTPSKTGAALLKLIVTDDLGGEKEVALNFNVTNPAIRLTVTNQESSLIYKKPTAFNVAISKPGYTGSYTYEVVQEPAASGTLTIDGKAYSGGIQNVANPNNLLVGFTPTTDGYVSLVVKVSDQTGTSAEKTVGFSVVNAPVKLTLNAPDVKTIGVGQTVSFTAKASKEGYTGEFGYELTPLPVDCGTVTVNGGSNMSGTLKPNPATINFTAMKTGTAIFNVKVSDSDGKYAEDRVVFNVENTPMTITFANNESNIILKTPTNFVFKVTKNNYPDSKMIAYTVSPAYTGTLVVDGKAYTGTSISVPYSKVKAGIPVQFIPDREGTPELTFTAIDEFNGLATKSLSFNVSNPELKLYLTGVNTEAPNEATLGSTYKFYYNVTKANYNDDFAYWLTLDPQAVGIIGTSDATPRGRSGGGVQMETGTIRSNQNGVTTGEIRFTPSNADYLNREVSVNVLIRDKWNNEKSQTVKFKVVTSAIQINVTRRTSIDVEVPYTFHFTVNKPGYAGKFKYMITGWADGDKLETSADNNSWTTYAGGKFDLPHKDHTYIRYTPAAINTIPMRLFVYDETNGEAMQELTFDVKAPEVVLTTDAASKQGYLSEFVPFKLTATEGKKENVTLAFATDQGDFSGELKFNNTPVIAGSSRARAASSNVAVASGVENKLEIMSKKIGSWGVTTTGTNRWKQSASVTTSINTDEKVTYTLTTNKIGEGSIDRKVNGVTNNGPNYEPGTIISLTATPADGYRFINWTGDLNGTTSPANITMNSDKNVVAVFEKIKNYAVYVAKNDPSIGNVKITANTPNIGPGYTYKAGTTVTLAATMSSKVDFFDWSFSNWLIFDNLDDLNYPDKGRFYSSSPTIEVYMDSDKFLRPFGSKSANCLVTVGFGLSQVPPSWVSPREQGGYIQGRLTVTYTDAASGSSTSRSVETGIWRTTGYENTIAFTVPKGSKVTIEGGLSFSLDGTPEGRDKVTAASFGYNIGTSTSGTWRRDGTFNLKEVVHYFGTLDSPPTNGNASSCIIEYMDFVRCH